MSTSELPELSRPFKRRKFYRKRVDADGNNEISTVSPPLQPTPLNAIDLEPKVEQNSQPVDTSFEAGGDLSLPVVEALRQRKNAQRKRGGVEFTSAIASTLENTRPSTALVRKEENGTHDDIKSVISRFVPQTGQITEETDKHMMAYIDSELAKRSQQINSSNTPSPNQTLSLHSASIEPARNRQPAALGKLHEIDLGPDAKLRNIARTEAAISGDAPDETPPPKPPRPRIGRNGKIYIPRPRKRRNSKDIARDQIVDQVLRETRLEVYDEPDAGSGDEGVDGDQAADDRLAEEFRREFLDAISQRRQRHSKAPATKGKTRDEKPKGPKLGGSRSARAAMRERGEANVNAKATTAGKGRR